jgi:hypothetical protein
MRENEGECARVSERVREGRKRETKKSRRRESAKTPGVSDSPFSFLSNSMTRSVIQTK